MYGGGCKNPVLSYFLWATSVYFCTYVYNFFLVRRLTLNSDVEYFISKAF